MCKLSPAEAFEHVKALWPETTVLLKNSHGWTARNATASFMAAGTSGINIDWAGEECYPAPVKVTYREPTLEDIRNGIEVELSDREGFPAAYTRKDILTGFSKSNGLLSWRTGSLGWKYCRVPVTLPAGWREITEADKITFSSRGDAPNCDLQSDTGEIASSCYWNYDEQWKVYGGPRVTFTPAFIRKAQ